jgi:lysozyme family protein
MTFDGAMEQLLSHEGGYVNHAADPGGKTRYGVTEAVARAHGYTGDMREYPLVEAKKVYRAAYWNPARIDDLPDAVQYDVFDGAVHSGVSQSVKWLQLAVGAADDGVIGPKTIAATVRSDPYRTLARYNGHRLAFLASLGNWPSFGKGWARRVAKNLQA